jgi:hypothetical protein
MGFFSSIKNAIKKVPVVGSPLAAVYGVAVAPAALAESIAKGQRVDRALVANFKDQVKDIKTLAPYAAQVVTFVPGVGQGVGAAMAAATALANGQPLSAAVLSGIKGAIPGGQLAQGAFGAVQAVAQGKSLDQVALSSLPLPDAQKQALKTALSVASKIGKGERVDAIVLDTALKQLPPDVQKAVHVGLAVGHAANIQKKSHVAAKKVVKVLNGVNSKNPAERAAALKAVKLTQAKAEKGDPKAAEMLTFLGRHAAAQRVKRRFRVDAKTAMVLRVGAA